MAAVRVLKSFFDLSRVQLEADFQAIGLQKYRADQLWHWVYQRGILNFDLMTTFNAQLREQLGQRYSLSLGNALGDHASEDGTRKWLLSFNQATQSTIETVFIPEANRGTACLSSQIGCSLNCSFCHTGAMSKSRLRNLTCGEIISQFMLQRTSFSDFPSSAPTRIVTNVVFMGMGEPLLNYKNVKMAAQILSDGDGLAVSKHRIILSTSGIVPLIERVGSELGVGLAISLHAVNDDLRNTLVPINKTYPIATLLEACRRYPALKNARKITFEYVMLKGINDSVAEAKELVRLLKGIPALVNLIPFNPWPNSGFECSNKQQIIDFSNELEGHDYLKCTIRWPRGRDIMAACGQLSSASHQATPQTAAI